MKDYRRISQALLLFVFIIISSKAFAARIVKEGFYVFDGNNSYKHIIKSHPDLTIDLADTTGYEIYGPDGTGLWLEAIGADFIELRAIEEKASNNYPSPEEIDAELERLAKAYPNITKLVKIGESVQGRDLLFIKISDNPGLDEVEPEFKYIGNMHGNEIANRDVLLKFVEYLLTEYGKNTEITDLIDNTEIWIMVSMNPDGAARKRRGNARWVDLNRDFPDFTTSDNTNTGDGRAKETKAVMEFQNERNFAFSANFHGGAVCINYPWDTTSSRPPLLDFIIEVSSEYASKIPEMANSYQFPGGITNGYDWYEVNGGMQDWSFYWHGDLQVTVEMHGYKWPNYRKVQEYFDSHKESLIAFTKRIHQGAGFTFEDPTVKGRVQIFKIEEDYKEVKEDLGNFSFKHGEFYKVLDPGFYEFIINTNSRGNRHVKMTVEHDTITPDGNYRRLD